jgi:hypothetical protein
MKYTLTKLSQPGWERDFYDKHSLQRHLYLHVCEQCRCEEGITEISTIADMLATACGCEFYYEETP